MRRSGKIRSWNDQRGFGFIESSDGGRDVFLHISALKNRGRRPETGQSVNYTLATDAQGRPTARNVLLPGDRKTVITTGNGKTGSLLVSGLFLGSIAVLTFSGRLPDAILLGYFGLSALAFLLYASDKAAAKDGGWRTSEETLHWLSLLGGWPGALVAQQTLRHKSKKQSFRNVFWITVMLNLAALIWIMSPHGNEFLAGWGR